MQQVTEFSDFSQLVNEQFKNMAMHDLYVVDVNKDDLWNTYLDAFPEGTNEIYKERREHDCNCCSQFVKRIGNVVAIIDGKVESVWHLHRDAGYPYNEVANVLDTLVSQANIRSVFLHDESKVGQKTSIQVTEDQEVINWNHFWCTVPQRFVVSDIATKRSRIDSAAGVFKRGLDELPLDALDIVADLINDNAIYRGEEFKAQVDAFRTHKSNYLACKSDEQNKSLYVWSNIKDSVAKFKNTVIGTLVSDISDGVDLEQAVAKYEAKVAPQNYKRSSAIITKAMVTKAMETIDNLGIRDALERRHATISDVSVNDILYVNRDVQPLMRDALADDLMAETKPKGKKRDPQNVTEVSIADFIEKTIVGAGEIKLQVENNQVGNFMSIIAPTEPATDFQLFKWVNNFSWSYNGNMTDSIKERVKNAGGKIDARLRISLSWDNVDDLDLHVHEPDGTHIYFGNQCGKLDVDMNAGGQRVRGAVENVAINDIKNGVYRVVVNNYSKRENTDVGFTIEVECHNQVWSYTYDKAVPNGRNIEVVDLCFRGDELALVTKDDKITVGSAPVEVWGLNTQEFIKVNTIMLSPNHWHDQQVGNKHWFFLLEGCKNPEPARGIYNEFLNSQLNEHRKVFEVLADKTKCAVSDDQLSGVGFSSTKSTTFTAMVDNRFYKVTI